MKKRLLAAILLAGFFSGCHFPSSGQAVYKWAGDTWYLEKIIIQHDNITTERIKWQIENLNATVKPQ